MTRLRELRKSKKLSMKAFGEIFNLSESTISLYETGKHDPDLETMIQFADFFKVSLDYLVGRTDNPSVASDVIIENADGKITSLDDAGLAREDLDRISGVIEDIRKKYSSSATDEVHEDEPSVLAAHADGITEEEMQEDIKKMKDYMRRKNDRV